MTALHRPILLPILFLLLGGALSPAAEPVPLAARLAEYADLFAQKAPSVVTQETLVQRCYRVPAHPRVVIGRAPEPLPAQYVLHEVVSQYGVGSLKGDPSGNLLEFRELVSLDGAAVQTPESARRSLAADVKNGEDKIRKKILTEFTKLGLLDVATDYGLMLLAFTTRGQKALEFEPAGAAWVGTEEATLLNWRQTSGGALEFRGRKAERRAMHGSVWLRNSDGAPLRIFASFEHEEPQHTLRDDAYVDLVRSSFGCQTPAAVVHRHYVDDVLLTENLYTYQPFRSFGSETNIIYTDVKDR